MAQNVAQIANELIEGEQEMNEMLPDAVANATELRKSKKGPKL